MKILKAFTLLSFFTVSCSLSIKGSQFLLSRNHVEALTLSQSFFYVPTRPLSSIAEKQFQQDIQNLLPTWKKSFEKYGNKYGIPWTLVAAIAYQESKWNNDARSYTGVRGLMQLTTQTAEHLGVKDRKNAQESIRGGAMYLQYLFSKTPATINSFDRWVQALAAYNIGWAHLRDIHRLAQTKKKNAYSWRHLKELLPLKADEQYEEVFRFGLARGGETVNFVESVLTYYQFLNLQFSKNSIALQSPAETKKMSRMNYSMWPIPKAELSSEQ